MKSVELFVGAGGLAIGVSRAGFLPEAVVEWNHDACETIRDNKRRGVDPVAKWPLQEMDVREFDYRSVRSQIDLLAGGPPCQPFSLGGKHRGNQDSRDMFPQVVRAVRELKPRAILIENVKGLTRATFAKYFNYIQLQLRCPEIFPNELEGWMQHSSRLERKLNDPSPKELRYKLSVRVLNAANYGVPQKRERVFFVGFRSDLDIQWDFPDPTHSLDALLWDKWISGEYWERHRIAKSKRPSIPINLVNPINRLKTNGKPATKAWRTVRDAICDLPTPTISGSDLVYNHRLIQGARQYPGHTGSPLDMPSKTIKAGAHGVPGGENMLSMPNGKPRYFTIRESARIQTFPDNYEFPGSWSESMRQLGNAVPVELGYAVANKIGVVLKANTKWHSLNTTL
jgi:DNA (cytosine-5)-methyltransferase 1